VEAAKGEDMKTIRSILTLLVAAACAAVASSKKACSGAELYSLETVQYGRWEVRMLAGAKSGTVSSFFTYYNNSHEGGLEPWREIDIEVLGKDPRGVQSNLITGSAKERKTSDEFHPTEADLSKTFSTYVVEWTPDSIVWELDGKRIRKTGADSQVVDLRSKPQSYRMNLWASVWPDWSGPFEVKSLPACQMINWIRFSNYTPKKGPGGSNWTEAWVDDFDTFDDTRWGKGTWGFEGNYAVFTPANLQLRDGMAVLALTRRGEEGIGCGYARGMYPEDPMGRNYPKK
jgi:endo-1,3-1,4-beta-glycanase ExoK